MRNDNEKARNLRRLNPASVARFRETYDDAIREDSYDEKRKKPSRFALFYIITLLAAVIACVAVFAVFFTRIRRDREESLPSVTDSVTPEIEEKAVVSETRQITCVITFKGADFIEVTDVENGQAHTLNVGRGSKFKNERNQTITVSDLSVGQVLEGSFDTRTSVADAMSLSAKTWEQKLVSGVSVSANALVYGNDILKYDENTVIMYKEKKISASGASDEITAADIVTMRGYGDKIWFLEINKSHGFIRFIAKDTIQDGALEIDSKTYMSLDDAENVPALEGAHKITVTGSNIEDFSADITVERGRSEIIDLSEAKFTASVIKITSAIEGYKLIIDGEERSTDDTLALPMGEYRFEAYKEGYLPWIKSVEAKEPETEVKIELVEEVILRALVIDTFPAAAELYVDNGYVGHAPVTELVTEGKHTIAAKLEGYSDATLEADVTSETDGERYSLRLIKKSDDSQSQKEETLTIPIDGRY